MPSKIPLPISLTIASLAVFLTGCASRPFDVNQQFNPPSGFAAIKNVRADLPAGTTIYNINGDLAGTVKGFEPNHSFPQGYIDLAISVQIPDVPEPIWMTRHNLSRRFFVKAK